MALVTSSMNGNIHWWWVLVVSMNGLQATATTTTGVSGVKLAYHFNWRLFNLVDKKSRCLCAGFFYGFFSWKEYFKFWIPDQVGEDVVFCSLTFQEQPSWSCICLTTQHSSFPRRRESRTCPSYKILQTQTCYKPVALFYPDSRSASGMTPTQLHMILQTALCTVVAHHQACPLACPGNRSRIGGIQNLPFLSNSSDSPHAHGMLSRIRSQTKTFPGGK